MRSILLFLVLALCIIGCQKETSDELTDDNNQNTDSTGVEAIYARYESEGNIYYEDSIILRYSTNRTDEVHYYSPADSSIKSYRFDAAEKLTEIDCPKGIFDPSGSTGVPANATNMKFSYDATGELSRIDYQYSNHAPTTTWFNFSRQGEKFHAIVYDTASSQTEKKIIYYRLNSERYLEQDSTIFIESTDDYTLCYNYYHDANDDVTQSIMRGYYNGNIAILAITDYTRHEVNNPYVLIRQKSYNNLANWFPFTHYFGFELYSALSVDPPTGLVNGYKRDEYTYLATTEHYESTWQSVIEKQNDKLSQRVSTITSPGLESYTLTERFYHK